MGTKFFPQGMDFFFFKLFNGCGDKGCHLGSLEADSGRSLGAQAGQGYIVCKCPTCVLCVSASQKSVSDPQELKLELVVSHHAGAGNQTRVPCKSNRCS